MMPHARSFLSLALLIGVGALLGCKSKGPAPGEAALVADDPRGWIAAQIDPVQTVPPAFAGFGPSSETLAAFFKARREGAEALKALRQNSYRKKFTDELVTRTRVMIATPVRT